MRSELVWCLLLLAVGRARAAASEPREDVPKESFDEHGMVLYTDLSWNTIVKFHFRPFASLEDQMKQINESKDVEGACLEERLEAMRLLRSLLSMVRWPIQWVAGTGQTNAITVEQEQELDLNKDILFSRFELEFGKLRRKN